MHSHLAVQHFTPPPVAELSDEARLMLKAARMWVMLARHQRSAKPVLQTLLPHSHAAFSTLMEAVVTCWPDAYTAFSPCAAQLSPDESTLLDLLAHAMSGDRVEAHALLADMLPVTDRERLFIAATRATSALPYAW